MCIWILTVYIAVVGLQAIYIYITCVLQILLKNWSWHFFLYKYKGVPIQIANFILLSIFFMYDILLEYLQYINKIKKLTPWTQVVYKRYLSKYHQYCVYIWCESYADITTESLGSYYDRLKHTKITYSSRYKRTWATYLHHNTIVYNIRCIRKFMERCSAMWYPAYPYKLIHVPKMQEVPIEQASRSDITKILQVPFEFEKFEHLKLRNHLLLTVWIYCWLRISEALSLNISDIRGKESAVIRGKMWLLWQIVIPQPVHDSLEKYIAIRKWTRYENDILFVSFKHAKSWQRLGYDWVRKMVRNYNKFLNLDTHFHYHLLRHAFVTNIYENSQDIKIAQHCARHRCIKSTQRYTHVSNDSARNAVNKLVF